MKTKLKVLTGLVLLIFLTTSLTLVALAETSDKDESLFNPQEVGLAPDGIELLTIIDVLTTTDDLTPNGNCTLREAIKAANDNMGVDDCLPGSSTETDIIMLPSGVYTLTLGDLRITSTMTIMGAGAGSTIIDGINNTGRIFRIQSSGVATISDVTLTNGSDTKGGGIWIFHGVLTLLNSAVSNNTAFNNGGGGIFSEEATLTVDNSTFTNNTARGGGGIFNESGTVTINNTTISENTSNPQAPTFGFGIGVGGGIANSAKNADGTLTINQSTIISNTAKGTGGGGINNSASFTNNTATVTLNQSVVSGNKANPTAVNFSTGFGGGIRNGFADPANGNTTAILIVNDSIISNNEAVNGAGIGSGTTSMTPTLTLKTTLNNSTISGNTTTYQNSKTLEGNGGGLVNVNGTLSLVNSTVSGNSATGGDATSGGLGGGIFNGNIDSRLTTLWLTNTTITSNTVVNEGEGVANYKAGTTAPVVNFKNTIIAGGCVNGKTGIPSTAGTLTSHGNNLDDDNTCSLTATGDVPGVNPLLGLLQSNGGPTIGATGATAPMLTHSLLKGSSAIDGGDNTTCNASPVNSLDQRGQPRPGSGSSTCDMGAVEVQGANLALIKTASHTTVDTVTTITYTITINNLLADGASGVVVSDTLPMSVTMVSSNTTNGSTYNPTTGVWDVGSVAGNGNVVLTLVVSGTLNEGETITNTATITTSTPIDLNASNDSDSAAITVGSTGSTGVFLPIVIKG